MGLGAVLGGAHRDQPTPIAGIQHAVGSAEVPRGDAAMVHCLYEFD